MHHCSSWNSEAHLHLWNKQYYFSMKLLTTLKSRETHSVNMKQRKTHKKILRLSLACLFFFYNSASYIAKKLDRCIKWNVYHGSARHWSFINVIWEFSKAPKMSALSSLSNERWLVPFKMNKNDFLEYKGEIDNFIHRLIIFAFSPITNLLLSSNFVICSWFIWNFSSLCLTLVKPQHQS